MKQNSLYGMGLLGLGVLLAYLYRLQLPFALILILTELFIFPKWLMGKQRQKIGKKGFQMSIFIWNRCCIHSENPERFYRHY